MTFTTLRNYLFSMQMALKNNYINKKASQAWLAFFVCEIGRPMVAPTDKFYCATHNLWRMIIYAACLQFMSRATFNYKRGILCLFYSLYSIGVNVTPFTVFSFSVGTKPKCEYTGTPYFIALTVMCLAPVSFFIKLNRSVAIPRP